MGKDIKRQSNIELLRMLAMMAIILLHMMNHGGIIDLSHPFESNFVAGWILFSPGFCAINVFLLISGYFLVEQHFSTWRIAKFVGQVLFYSLAVTVIFAVFFKQNVTIKELIYSIFPISSDFYWYASMYVGMYLLSPLINRFVKGLTKNQHRICCYVLFALLSVWTNIFYYSSGMNIAGGVSIAWFVAAYIFGAYIRLHYVPDGRWGKRLLKAVGLMLLMPLSKFLIEWIVTTPLGKIDVFSDLLWGYSIFYSYSSILAVWAAVSLLIAFLNMDIKPGIVSKGINILASGAFGVYLLHDHLYVRDNLWNFIGVSDWIHKWYLVPMSLLAMILLYLAGTIIELLRQKIFSLWEKDSALKRFFLGLDVKIKEKWNK